MRPLWQVGVALAIGVALAAGFAALGVWQVQRLGWKQDLIARVDARVHAAPVPWTDIISLAPEDQEYRRVSVTGRFDHGAETLVKAVTERGGGYWVLTPLQAEDGQTILINRGFVPPERADPQTRQSADGIVTVTGLARLSEPGGAFLRANDPAGNRWYSRDVQAVAAASGLTNVAAFFIDADATPMPGGYPVGGLTVIAFRNTHLAYALTWFGLAAMSAGGVLMIARQERRARMRAGYH